MTPIIIKSSSQIPRDWAANIPGRSTTVIIGQKEKAEQPVLQTAMVKVNTKNPVTSKRRNITTFIQVGFKNSLIFIIKY